MLDRSLLDDNSLENVPGIPSAAALLQSLSEDVSVDDDIVLGNPPVNFTSKNIEHLSDQLEEAKNFLDSDSALDLKEPQNLLKSTMGLDTTTEALDSIEKLDMPETIDSMKAEYKGLEPTTNLTASSLLDAQSTLKADGTAALTIAAPTGRLHQPERLPQTETTEDERTSPRSRPTSGSMGFERPVVQYSVPPQGLQSLSSAEMGGMEGPKIALGEAMGASRVNSVTAGDSVRGGDSVVGGDNVVGVDSVVPPKVVPLYPTIHITREAYERDDMARCILRFMDNSDVEYYLNFIPAAAEHYAPEGASPFMTLATSRFDGAGEMLESPRVARAAPLSVYCEDALLMECASRARVLPSDPQELLIAHDTWKRCFTLLDKVRAKHGTEVHRDKNKELRFFILDVRELEGQLARFAEPGSVTPSVTGKGVSFADYAVSYLWEQLLDDGSKYRLPYTRQLKYPRLAEVHRYVTQRLSTPNVNARCVSLRNQTQNLEPWESVLQRAGIGASPPQVSPDYLRAELEDPEGETDGKGASYKGMSYNAGSYKESEVLPPVLQNNLAGHVQVLVADDVQGAVAAFFFREYASNQHVEHLQVPQSLVEQVLRVNKLPLEPVCKLVTRTDENKIICGLQPLFAHLTQDKGPLTDLQRKYLTAIEADMNSPAAQTAIQDLEQDLSLDDALQPDSKKCILPRVLKIVMDHSNYSGPTPSLLQICAQSIPDSRVQSLLNQLPANNRLTPSY
ncbi:hypothetical protein GNI_025590 [Gregarina niphandrodes]|uniref:Uncharacterized protein n=1 Tax=Gregarina niphandrodes TaxID=110365 RepID=A0A023BBN1_GRENI|nr:hypothetical protein GNI_025590 [Gregarina niphandrodes]EZG79521.1 hypothetical protein GNI_025590 [Gregarina niphandrodes]|eukprot:XP_011134418.1 hypothetical protein GNI_025590 [Gregarina niphandrodes]